MPKPTVLWVDLCKNKSSSGEAAGHLTGDVCDLIHETDPTALERRVGEVAPWLVVMDYDYPSPLGLTALREIKQRFPRIPVLMLTEQHCESLAVWAFRTGARDYLVKPLDAKMLCGLVRVFAVEPAPDALLRVRSNLMPPPPLPMEARCAHTPVDLTTQPVVRWVVRHYHERITLDDAARLCKMGPYEFSRRFKKEQGENFRDFLIRMRVEKAKELLRDPIASVADVAHNVGFADPPHFARMFRRLVGVSPTNYRLNGFPA